MLADCKLSRYFRWQRINCRLTRITVPRKTPDGSVFMWRLWLFGQSFSFIGLDLAEKLNEADIDGGGNPFRALPDYIMQTASEVTAERVFPTVLSFGQKMGVRS